MNIIVNFIIFSHLNFCQYTIRQCLVDFILFCKTVPGNDRWRWRRLLRNWRSLRTLCIYDILEICHRQFNVIEKFSNIQSYLTNISTIYLFFHNGKCVLFTIPKKCCIADVMFMNKCAVPNLQYHFAILCWITHTTSNERLSSTWNFLLRITLIGVW